MNVIVENVEELARKVIVTLPESEVNKELDKSYRKVARNAKLNGFRKGKAPRYILESHFKDRVEAEVGEKMIQESYPDAIGLEKLDVASQPEITEFSYNEDGTFSYTAAVEVQPVIELGDYKGVEISAPAVSIADSEIDEEIEALRRQQGVRKTAEEGHQAANEDQVTLEVEGSINDEVVKDLCQESRIVEVGSPGVEEGLASQLVGCEKEAELAYSVEIPKGHKNVKIAGQTAQYRARVKNIQVLEKPALDDEFAKDVNADYETLVDLRTQLTNNMQERKTADRRAALDRQIMDTLLERHVFPVPKAMVAMQAREMVGQAEQNLRRAGLTLEQAGIDREAFAANYVNDAERLVKEGLLLAKIGEVESLTVTEEELEAEYGKLAEQHAMTVEALKELLAKQGQESEFAHKIASEKIWDLLRDAANETEAAAPESNETESQEAAQVD